jgi:recombination associated protein RdgC
MDLVDLVQEKKFVGQEFLAWLWFKSEERGGPVDIPGIGDVLVVFEKHMLLEYGEGDSSEKVICRGLQTELKEARAGLLMGKKPEQARIRLVRGDYEFNVTMTAATMEFRNVKLPKTVAGSDEGDDPESMEGRLLERVSLFEQLVELVDELFRMYIGVRAFDRWPEELGKIQTWVHRGIA